MPLKQKSKFAILGLLSWKPMSGYDIKKLVDAGLSHFWNENYGQIYPTLESLVKDGLAERQIDRASGNRKRFTYSITREGQRAFREWLAEPADAPIVRNELQLKFFLSCKRPTKDVVRLVNEYRTKQQAVLDEYKQSEKVLRQAVRDSLFPEELGELLESQEAKQSGKDRAKQCKMFLLTLRHGIRAVQARLAWCEEVVKELDT